MRLKTGIFLLSCVRCFSRITATVFFTTPADKLDRTCLTRRSWNERRRLTRKQPWQSSIFQATRKYSLRDGTAIYHQRRMPFAFASIYWKSGTWVLAAAAFATIGKSLQSEAFQRAMYFWVHAGPIVAHYKFTRWWLRKIKAPLERRDRVYNALHDRYCVPSFRIALHLKGN